MTINRPEYWFGAQQDVWEHLEKSVLSVYGCNTCIDWLLAVAVALAERR
jgi:hypothetical protein